jgi:phenylacetate-CoA ligase
MALDIFALQEGFEFQRQMAARVAGFPSGVFADGIRILRDDYLGKLTKTNPVYQQLTKGLDLEDWSALPILSKTDLLRLQGDLIAAAGYDVGTVEAYLNSGFALDKSLDGRTLAYRSSGSSGYCTSVLQSAHDLGRIISAYLNQALVPLLGRKPRIAYIGVMGQFNGGNQWAYYLGKLASTAIFDLLQPLDSYIAEIKSFAPDVLISRPRTILEVVERLVEGGTKPAALTCVAVGEVAEEAIRAELADRFGLLIHSSYATSEIGPIGFQSDPTIPALDLYPALVHVDLVDANLLPVTEADVQGTIVATTLFADRMPLIRYSTGDISAWYPSDGPRRLRLVGGRSLKNLHFVVDGVVSSVNERHVSNLRFDGVREYRLVQIAPNGLRIDYVATPDRTPIPNLLSHNVAIALAGAKCTLPIKIDTCACVEIPRDPRSGKVVRVVPFIKE